MKRLRSFFNSVKESLLSPASYVATSKSSFSSIVGYLYCLFLLTGLVVVVPVAFMLALYVPEIPQTVVKIKSYLESAYPKDLKLTIKNGELSANVLQPYYIDLPPGLNQPGSTVHLVAIDTKAYVEDYGKYNSVVLATKTALVYPRDNSSRSSVKQNEVVFFKDFGDNYLDYQKYLQTLDSLAPLWKLAQPIILGLIAFLLFVSPFLTAAIVVFFHMIYLAFFTVPILLICKVLHLPYTYKDVYKISARASTLPIIFFMILGIVGLVPPIPFAYSILLAVFFFAIVMRIPHNKASK